MFGETEVSKISGVWGICFFAYILLPFLLLWRARINVFYVEGLNKENTEALKGLAILLIILHHITQALESPGLMSPFIGFGYMGVAIFFFLSGYGLSMSGLAKRNYTDSFFRRRIFRVWLPYVLVNIVSLGVAIVCYHQSYSIHGFIFYALGIRMFDGVTWFVYAIMFFYLLFYLCFNYFSVKHAILALFTCVFLYASILHFFHFGANLINSAFAFPLGVLIAHAKMQIFTWLRSCYTKCLLGVLVIFAGFYLLGIYPAALGLHVKTWIGISQILSMNALVLFVCVILCKLELHSRSMVFIGGVSYEMYLIHMKVRYIYFGTYEGNDIFVYLLLTILISVVFKRIGNYITAKGRNKA